MKEFIAMAMLTKKSISLCIAAVLLVGCAAPGPAFHGWEQLPPGKAMLYAYRTLNFQPDMTYTVKVDGTTVGPLHHDGYLAVPIAPGVHTIQIFEATYLAPATQPIVLDAEAGKIYTVQYDTSEVRFNYSGFNLTPLMYGHRKIVLRTPEQALPVLQTRNRSNP